MNSENKLYQHIIWDWNGTLFNDVDLCVGIMNSLLEQELLPKITTRRYKEIFTFPVVEYYKNAGHKFEKTTFEVLGRQFVTEYENMKYDSSLFTGVKEILENFQRLETGQHLLSAYEQVNLNSIIKKFAIDNYFNSVSGLDNIYAAGKMDIGKKLMDDINSNGNTGKVLLVGDTVHDFEVAEEIGADCILLSHGHQDKKRLLQSGARVIDSFEEFSVIFFGRLK